MKRRRTKIRFLCEGRQGKEVLVPRNWIKIDARDGAIRRHVRKRDNAFESASFSQCLNNAFDSTRQPRKRHHRLPSRSFCFCFCFVLSHSWNYSNLKLSRRYRVAMGAPPGVSASIDLLGPHGGCIDSKYVHRSFEANASPPVSNHTR